MSSPNVANTASVRASAVSSISQDMSSARLKILGDLMDHRKRAEQHEQEFLRTIHAENASFSQVVSLFESSLHSLKQEWDSECARLSADIGKHSDSLDSIRENLEQGISTRVAVIIADITRMKSDLDDRLASSSQGVSEAVAAISPRIDELSANVQSFQASLDECTKLTMSNQASIGSMQSQFSDLHSRLASQTDSLNAEIANLGAVIRTEIEQSRLQSSLALETRLVEIEKSTTEEFNRRLCGLEEQLEKRLADRLDSAVMELENKFADSLIKLEAEFSSKLEQYAKANTVRVDEVSQQVSLIASQSVRPETVEELLRKNRETEKMTIEISSSEKAVDNLRAQVEALAHGVTERLSQHSAALESIAHAGYHHEWLIAHAGSKFKSLGIAEGKYVSSDTFEIGPYKNLQFRLYPLSSATNASPTVWLIHRPASVDSVTPVFVDISIGSSKKGPLRMKKVQELFGHWVWEASFPKGVVVDETTPSGDLEICVEISMRQWIDPNIVRPLDFSLSTQNMQTRHSPELLQDDEENLPGSPSGMSSYTFAAPAEQGGVLLPLPTNPFIAAEGRLEEETEVVVVKGGRPGSLTPRRSSWAKFGTTDESIQAPPATNVDSNPFR